MRSPLISEFYFLANTRPAASAELLELWSVCSPAKAIALLDFCHPQHRHSIIAAIRDKTGIDLDTLDCDAAGSADLLAEFSNLVRSIEPTDVNGSLVQMFGNMEVPSARQNKVSTGAEGDAVELNLEERVRREMLENALDMVRNSPEHAAEIIKSYWLLGPLD